MGERFMELIGVNQKRESQTYRLNGKEEPVRIPDSLFLDLYNPFIMKSMKFASVHTDKLNRLFLTLSGSDGAGGYDVIFIIHNGVFFKRFIAGPP